MGRFAALWLFVFGIGAGASESLFVGAGESIQLKSEPGQNIVVSNKAVVRVAGEGRHLAVYGRQPGEARVVVGARAWAVHVLSPENARLAELLVVETSRRRGLRLELRDAQVILSGRLLLFKDWLQIAELVPLGASYSFLADLDTEAKTSARALVREISQREGLPPLTLVMDGGFRVKLPKESEPLRDRVVAAYRRYGIAVEIDDQAVALAPLVRVGIVVTEIRKQFFRRLGIQWPSSLPATILPGFRPPGAGGDIMVQLNALEEEGAGKILASPKILCRSGKDASFFAGGEFPIKITNFKINDVIWKKYGILLTIKPMADRSGHISLGLETEVSSIDLAHAVDGVPGILANRISSHFDLEKSQTVALSGLLKTESGSSASGLPGLRRLPILGALFESEDFRENRTELVVFVTPEVLNEGGPTDAN